MRTTIRFGMIGLVMAALGSVLFFGSPTRAGEEEQRKKEVQAIADAIKQGKTDMARQLSEKLAKKEAALEEKGDDGGLYYVMLLMKPRDRKGFGVGDKPGGIIPDGIELKIQTMARDVISGVKLKKEAEALQEMAYRLAAFGHFSEASAPDQKKDKGKATRKAWVDLSQDLQAAALELEKAVQQGSTQEIKKAAARINTNCNNCHSIFRN